MAKKKTNGIVSLKEAYEKAMNQKKETEETPNKEIPNKEISGKEISKKEVSKKKIVLSSNTSGAKIDSSFELESFVKTDDSIDTPSEKETNTGDELGFSFEGLGIQVARRF